ncbi:hypothetical protein EZV62_001828 [Acer yangbiense]|uniref:DUF7806 domain-containing protein n=1 Tax=Acer yangbiense TaxID=1000413 RepID=A0A5C7IVZ9_9ROSI|nr:hypothetical protein EZV62_001828 [Acer yangbiense]
MESLYAKLYDKYDKLKKKKFSELDDINKDQELKFVNYVSAAEELIEYLRSDNVKSTNNEQCMEYQKLFMQEKQKNKVLSQEVERLQKLHQETISSCSKDVENDNMLLNTPEGAQTTSGKLSSVSAKRMTRTRRRESEGKREGMVMVGDSGRDDAFAVESAKDSSKETVTRKRRRESEGKRQGMVMAGDSGRDDAIAVESAKDLSKETVSNGAAYDQQCDLQPECCKRTIDRSGGAIDDGPGNSMFHDLIEYLVDMKLSACHQTEGTSILALHQSSGYSFNLTWVKNEAEEESELLYRVSSLGTFERVAPDWMRDAIMFSVSMCPMFFEKITRFIKLDH